MPDAPDTRTRARSEVLRALGAEDEIIAELLEYNDLAFDRDHLGGDIEIPLPDEPHVGAWEGYAANAERVGVLAALQTPLPELRFPVREGMSRTDAYRDATRKGLAPQAEDAPGIELDKPEGLRLLFNDTAGGRVPVVVSASRADFVSLVQAITHHNEPEPVPESMGACMIGGHNNWARISAHRDQWTSENPAGNWDEEFHRLIAHQELYKDQLLLLSDGPYSAVQATALGLDEEVWRQHSLTIRMNHECTHYATRRLFGSARNRALDETIADYMGIVAANGAYRADWFLHFAGLENFPVFRPGGRLGNYRGDPPISDRAFGVLQAIVVRAAHHIEAFDSRLDEADRTGAGRAAVLCALAGLTLEEIAGDGGADRLTAALAQARR